MSSRPELNKAGTKRISMADEGPMTGDQRVVYDRIVSGKRGKVVGPLRAVLHSPELADRWQALGELLRYDTSIPAPYSELAVIMTGRYWQSQVEWVIHARIAKEVGVSDAVVEAIRTANVPEFDDEQQFLIYEFTREFLSHGNVADCTYSRLAGYFDAQSLVELTSIIAYYTMVAMTLNVHAVPIPDDENEALLPNDSIGELPHLRALPAARFVGES